MLIINERFVTNVMIALQYTLNYNIVYIIRILTILQFYICIQIIIFYRNARILYYNDYYVVQNYELSKLIF